MSTQAEAFFERLKAAFKVEAEEHCQALASGLLELECGPGAERQQELIETVFREAHSLKGAARAVNLGEVERLCQQLETVFAEWKRQSHHPAPEDFDCLSRSIDTIRKLTAEAGASPPAASGDSTSAASAGIGRTAAATPMRKGPPAAEAATAAPRSAPAVDRPPQATAGAPQPPPSNSEPSRLSETIRVSTAKLERLLLEVEELIEVKLAGTHRAAELRELGRALEGWQARWTKLAIELRRVRPSADGGGRGPVGNVPGPEVNRLLEFLDSNDAFVRGLGGKVADLARAIEQDRLATARAVEDLVAEAKELLLLPCSTVLGAFPKFVRDLARDQGKDIELVIRGGEVELDKRILEQMKDPLVHLLRNGVDHGIETPSVRTQHHKPARGTLNLTVSRLESNQVEMVLSDDGAGIDSDRVTEAAVKRGIVTETEARRLTADQQLALIFHSEVSTSPTITEISGRGLGLAIVQEKVNKLGGRVSVRTEPGCGTTFRMVLPTAQATVRGILVEVSQQQFVVPMGKVVQACRVRREEIQTVENRETIPFRGRAVALVRLSDVLGLRRRGRNGDEPGLQPVLVLGTDEQQVAFAVDVLLREEEVLVKPWRKPLSRVRNISAATRVGSGRTVPILNVSDLLKSAVKTGAAPPTESEAQAPKAVKTKTLLVVEDSITSRMLLKNILESSGYRVRTAVDGLDALTTLRSEECDLVVSDVEMPRMNGFDLTAAIRADRRLAELPVILVTALASREDRERGIEVGANAYLAKSSFDQRNLLEAIRRLV